MHPFCGRVSNIFPLTLLSILNHRKIANLIMFAEAIRNNLAACIKNTQSICSKDVEKFCLDGKTASAKPSAYTDWSEQYIRHMYKQWEEVPLGFGAASDECFKHKLDQDAKRLVPKCVEWMEKTEGQFEKLYEREKGNDKREIFVIFSTLFALAVSGVVGYMIGIFLKERDDIFSYQNREENKKILIYFGIAIALPCCIILWASPKLLMLMILAFGTGMGVQFYIQKRQSSAYSSVPGGESGLVFAAIPVQMD